MRDRSPAAILAALLALAAVAAPVARAEVLEEVVAVVGTTPILASDVDLAEIVELVPPPASGDRDEHRARLLTARIRLELQLLDLEASGTLYRLDLDLERGRLLLLDRASEGAEPELRLVAAGIDRADLDDLALRLVAAEAYAEQRLRSRVTVTVDELEDAYAELVLEPMTTAGATPPPLLEVRDAVRAVLVERKLNDEIERWLADARERFDVTRFGP